MYALFILYKKLNYFIYVNVKISYLKNTRQRYLNKSHLSLITYRNKINTIINDIISLQNRMMIKISLRLRIYVTSMSNAEKEQYQSE